MLFNKKGTITCKVMTENKNLYITWEDEEGNDMASNPITPVNGMQNAYKSELDITYDEWTRGVKRFCVVHHQDLIEPLREPYKRDFDLFVTDSLELHHPGLSGDDNIASVAIVFILLFLITLLLIFGTTVIKVK
ncbi:unnamed protein product [Oreochromis niloticus]|nr:unnamed protein product [Mustela putorius furo]